MAINWKSIINVMEGVLTGELASECSGVTIDSRTTQTGNLYFALVGDVFDGHDFARSSLESGASAVVVARGRCQELLPRIEVDDPLLALQRLGGLYRDQFTGPVIAITGSHGKTTTKDMLASILNQKYTRTLATYRNLNGLIGVPLTLSKLTPDIDALTIEVGISEPGEMALLAPLVKPTLSIFTCVALTHTEFLKSLNRIAQEKASLLKHTAPSGIRLVNGDDPIIRHHCRNLDVKTFGFSSSDFTGLICESKRSHTTIKITPPDGTAFTVRIKLPGEHNAANALAACSAAWLHGLTPDEIQIGLDKMILSPHRSNIIALNEVTLIDDTYNAAPESMNQSIRMLETFPCSGERIAVLGDMLELGDLSKSAHETLGKQLRDSKLDAVVLYGAQMRYAYEILNNSRIPSIWFPCLEDASATQNDHIALIADRVTSQIVPGSVVLFKASRSMRADQILERIRENL